MSRKVVWYDGPVRDDWPTSCVMPDGREVMSPSIETCIVSGAARWETDQEQADREAQEAAVAQAAAAEDALYSSPEPVVLVPRVSGDLTAIVGTSQIFQDADTGQLFAVDETGSPRHTLAQKKAQDAARIAKISAARANMNGQLQKRIENIEIILGIRKE